MVSAPVMQFPRRPGLSALIVLAFFLLLFSYLFTVAVAIACAGLPWVAITHGFLNQFTLALLIVGLLMAVSILWSLLPRREKFKAPGAEVDLATEPRLQATIQEIASTLGEPMPKTVYLTPDVNAFVSEEGGVLGFGSRRILGLGLPLMATLSIAEFRGVLAHEFAHFYAGDSRLGPRVYSARSAMVRTITGVSEDSILMDAMRHIGIAHLANQLVVAVLVAYWKLFMRLTQLISRQQEYRSDEIACYLVGSEPLVQGLKRLHSAGVIAGTFWQAVVTPALTAGYRPPIADGFQRFVTAPVIDRLSKEGLTRSLATSKTSAYDTHPPLKHRLERAEKIGAKLTSRMDSSSAVTLLHDVERLEKELLITTAPDFNHAVLKSMDWETYGTAVYVPIWREFVDGHARLLNSSRVADIPLLVKDAARIAGSIKDPPGQLLDREQRTERAYDLIWMALALRALENGWTLYMQPGVFHFSKGDKTLRPPEVVKDLRSGKITGAAWAGWCEAQGIDPVSFLTGQQSDGWAFTAGSGRI